MSPVRLSGAGVEKRFGRVAALRGVDFEIAPGESVAVLGANGAGKSTILRILAGLSRPSAGRFEARGASVDAAAAPDAAPVLSRSALRGQVGYVGHATLLYGELSARENLAFAAQLHGTSPAHDALDALLERFALLEVAERRAGTFSRGMAQRLSIARAIVHEPDLLLLDEPFTGLDEASADRLSQQLARLRADGHTLVVVTHDPRRAVELADRALVLHRGEIRARPSGRPNAGAAAAPADGAFEVGALRELLLALAAGDLRGSAA